MRGTLHILILLVVLAIGNLPLASSIASAQTPGSLTIQPTGIIYHAQAGDTLMSIAQRLTARMANWSALEKINQISKDSNIPIGTAITIPTELLADESSEAIVIARSGTITAKSADGNKISLEIGSKILEGMQIDTGRNSFLTMSLADASRVSLPSNSSVLISRLRKSLYTGSPRTEVKLLQGRVVSRVAPLNNNKGRFEVRTPLSVAGVRGTHFRVGLEDRNVVTEVLDGRVTTGLLQVPETHILGSAQGNFITRDSVSPAIELLPMPRFASAPYRQNGVARFVLVPIANARAYHVQLAQDAEALHLLAEASSKTAEVAIENVAEGNYFVRITAIDQFGLEGMPRTVATSIRNRIEPAANLSAQAAPSVVDGDQKELVLRWPGSASQQYNLQLARDAEFSWLLFTSRVSGNEIRLPRPLFGTYFARVQNVNADGSTEPFSFVQPLIVTDHWIINDGHPLPPKTTTRKVP